MWVIRRRHNHIGPETLSEFLDGRLSSTAAAKVERHLPGCDVCRDELEGLRSTQTMLRSLTEFAPRRSFILAGPPLGSSVRSRPTPMFRAPQWAYASLAAAAALVLAVLLSADVAGLLAPSPRGESAAISAAAPVAEMVPEIAITGMEESLPTEVATGSPSIAQPGTPEATVAASEASLVESTAMAPNPTVPQTLSGARPEAPADRFARPEVLLEKEVMGVPTEVPKEVVKESAITIRPTDTPGSDRAQSRALASAASAPVPTGAPAAMSAEPASTAALSPTPTPALTPTTSPVPTGAPVPPTPSAIPLTTVTAPLPTIKPTATAVPPVHTPAPEPTLSSAQLRGPVAGQPEGPGTRGVPLRSADSRRIAPMWRILEAAAAALSLVFFIVFIIRRRGSGSSPRF